MAFAGPAGAATTGSGSTPLSSSAAQILNGEIAGTNLSTIAELKGITAQNFGGATVTTDNTPNVDLLNSALSVPLGQLKSALSGAIPGLSLSGLVEQKVVAKADGSATGNASTAGLGLNLSSLTGGATDALATLNLSLAAVTAHAAQGTAPGGAQTGSCTVAGLNLDLTVPLLKTLLSTLSTALKPLSTLTSTLNTALGPLASLVQIQNYDASGTVHDGLPSLTDLLTDVGTLSIEKGAVTINLVDGTVHISVGDLLQQLGLNFCSKPNNNILDQVASSLMTDLPKALTTLVNNLGTTVDDLLAVCPAGGPDVSCITLKALNGSVDLSSALGTITKALTGTSGVLTTLTSALGSVTSVLGTLVKSLADALTSVVSVIANVQTTSGGVFSETALQVNLLSGSPTATLPTLPTLAVASDPLLQLNLANASVGPQSVAPATSTPPPSSSTPTSTPPVKVDAGRPGPADGSFPVVWVGLILLLSGGVGAFFLRTRARHS